MRFAFTGVVLILLAGMSHANGQAVSASSSSAGIYGVVVDDQGAPAGGVRVTLGRVAGVDLKAPFSGAEAVADQNGVFVVSGLPSGLYRVCASATGGDLLNPCEWFPDPPAVILASGQVRGGVRVVMQHGRLLDIRLDDPQQVLKSTATQTSTNPDVVNVRVWSSRGVHSIPKTAEDAGGENHLVAVPIGVAVQLDVSSPTLAVTAQAGAAGVNVPGGPGAQPGATSLSTGSISTGSVSTDPVSTGAASSIQFATGDTVKQFRFSVAKAN